MTEVFDVQPYEGPVTQSMMALLLEADPSVEAVNQYISRAQIFVCTDQHKSVGIAAVVVTDESAELKNISVARAYQGRGLAKKMIYAVKAWCALQGATSIIVGTGNSSLSQLALYQKCGFRLSHIEIDYFALYPDPIFENGIRCLDRVVLKADL